MKNIILFIFIVSSLTIAQNFGRWTDAAPMNLDREYLASVILPSGNVLVTGGYSNSKDTTTNTCEEYDCRKNSWRFVASMNIPRSIHQLILLDSNRVIAIGGYKLTSCEIYNISEDKWYITDSLKIPRYGGWTANRLSNGKIIVTGGFLVGNDLKTFKFLNDTEIFDPVTEKWVIVDSLKIEKAYHTATLLNNGNLLIVGGETYGGLELNDCEEYDPLSDKWTKVDSLTTARYSHSATLLPNGTVFVSGGSNYSLSTSAPWLRSCEVYNSSINKWQAVGSMYYPRNSHYTILINDGYILFLGGDMGNDTWELYNISTFQSIFNDKFPITQISPRVEKLPDNEVISIGGTTWSNSSLPIFSSTPMCERYSTILDVNAYNNIPISFELFQNYPNPFNPSTTINYKITEPGYVSLKIYDVLGRIIDVLVDKWESSGKHKVSWRAYNKSSGIYMYKLQFDKYVVTKKMVLLH